MLVLGYAPVDPQKSGDDFMAWFSGHGGLIIGAIVLAAVAIGLYKALPKWVFLILIVAVAAIALGVVAK